MKFERLVGGWQRLVSDLDAALAGPGSPPVVADRLCRACADLLPVDGAAISLVHAGPTRGTFGASGELGRRLEELQFTAGEGPSLDTATFGLPELADDLQHPEERRWPAFAREAGRLGVRAVFALPVVVGHHRIGALTLSRGEPGPLPVRALRGAVRAADLAALPLVDLIGPDTPGSADDGRPGG